MPEVKEILVTTIVTTTPTTIEIYSYYDGSNWILVNGYWNDENIWIDDEFWKDN